jgi:hypothetical protein
MLSWLSCDFESHYIPSGVNVSPGHNAFLKLSNAVSEKFDKRIGQRLAFPLNRYNAIKIFNWEWNKVFPLVVDNVVGAASSQSHRADAAPLFGSEWANANHVAH